MYIGFILIAGLFGILMVRLAWVQVVKAPYFRELALEQRMRPVPVDPRRGAIYDRNGRELAVSISADSVYATPAEVRDAASVARQLAPILEMSESTLIARLTTNLQTVWLKRKVPHEAAMGVRKLSLPGIGVAESGQRFYPNDTLACQTLGISGVDNQGLEGLELYYDSQLRGVRGQIVAERDATGKEIPEGQHSYVAPVDGNSLVLTIDEVIQYIAERELARAMADTGAARGLVMAMDPKTSEILAIAMKPDFNPNEYNKFPAAVRRNFALTDQAEPGSIFKFITAAAALEEGVVTPNSGFFDPGFLKVGDRIINCHKAGGHGSETFTEAMENSCNPVFASLALRLGVDKFLQYARAFGLTERTGVDFPGEASGMMHQASKIGPVELATYGFGQGISVTAVQILNALCAVANGGSLMQPTLVREVRSPSGEVVSRHQPVKIRQVVSSRTASQLSRMLESVVVNGSGSRAAVKGYAVAGKTGTAQKPDKGRYGEGRIASFIGFAPVNDPRVALLVMLDEPKTDVKYGGVLAAPVFSAVMTDVLRYLEIPPTYPTTNKAANVSASTVSVPNVVGKTKEQAASALSGVRLSMRAERSGDIVISQTPKAGSQVEAGTSVIVYFGQEELYNREDAEVEVPDVAGMTLKDAALALGARGLTVNPVGKGVTARQDPAPGTKVRAGAAVTIFLEED